MVTRCVFRALDLLTLKPEDSARESKTALETVPWVSTSMFLTQPVFERLSVGNRAMAVESHRDCLKLTVGFSSFH